MPQQPQQGLVLTDWFHANHAAMELHNALGKRAGSGDLQNSLDDREYYVDGPELASFTYVSSLLGGRGRWPEHLPYPLSEYGLTSDVETRFRLVNAATEYAYEVLADGHSMTVIALDGYDIQPLSVGAFIINPGESIDFLLVPDQDTAQSGRYWLRAWTLGAKRGHDVAVLSWNVTHEVKAILAYDNETGTDPTSSERRCTAEKPCRIFNCPFAFYPDERNRTCLALTDARSAYTPDWLDLEFGLSNVQYKEYFLNFGFVIGSSINAVKFMPPRALLRPGQYDNDPHVVQCPDEAECQVNGCVCTHLKELPYNTAIQVLSSVLLKCNVTDCLPV